MNLYILVIYTATIGAFLSLLNAELSSSQVERQRKLLWWVLFFLVEFISFNLFASTESYVPIIQIHFLTFGLILPWLLSYVLLQRRKKAIIKSGTDLPYRIGGLLGIGAALVFLWLTLHNLEAKFDFDDISLLVCIALFAILSFTILLSTTSFCPDGIIYHGLFWAWSDFDSYSWMPHTSKAATALKLTSSKLWFIRKIKLQIPDKIKLPVEGVLSEKVIRK